MLQEIGTIQTSFDTDLKSISSVQDLEGIKSKYLGKTGLIPQLYKQLGRLSPEEKKEIGSKLNDLRHKAQTGLSEALIAFEEKIFLEKSRKNMVDMTLPLPKAAYGGRHPITQTMEYLIELLAQMGFDVGEGPELEHEDFNFTYLNIPEHHPARDDHDTFYIQKPWLLRTHTSPVQIHYMKKYTELPIQMIAPGRVYRADDDATHSPMFHQIEGLWVDKGIHFGHLKAMIKAFLQEIFEMDQVRFRPSFFPFTEPSAEVDIGCVFCNGRGCRVCKQTGWLEVMGSGLVHPKVLQYGGVEDPAVSGLAFGLGVERLTMLLFRIPDMRMLFDNDPRVLTKAARHRHFPHIREDA